MKIGTLYRYRNIRGSLDLHVLVEEAEFKKIVDASEVGEAITVDLVISDGRTSVYPQVFIQSKYHQLFVDEQVLHEVQVIAIAGSPQNVRLSGDLFPMGTRIRIKAVSGD